MVNDLYPSLSLLSYRQWAAYLRVGRGKDGCASIELADDARLGDRQGLLLHHLVQYGPTKQEIFQLISLQSSCDLSVKNMNT